MSFARHGLQTLLVRSSLIIFGIPAGIIVARWLGPQGVGVLAVLSLVKSFAFRGGNLGFGSAFAYYVARKQVSLRWIYRVTWYAGGILSVLAVVILLAVWRCDFSPWNDVAPSLFYLYLVSVPLMFFNNFRLRVLSGQLRITDTNIGNLILSVSGLVWLIVLVIILEMGLVGAVLSTVLSDLLMFVYYLWCSVKYRNVSDDGPSGDTHEVVTTYRLWQYGRWSYLLMFANMWIEELPLVILKAFTGGVDAVGFFAKARDLARRSRIVATPIAEVLFPYTAASGDMEARRRTNMVCRSYLVGMVVAVGILALFIKPVICLLYGKEFLPAIKVFYMIAPGTCLWPLSHLLGIHVAAAGRPKVTLVSSVGGLLAAVVICWLLIPKYGAIGAGISVSLIYAVLFCFRLTAYVVTTKSPVMEVLCPNREDWVRYRGVVGMGIARIKGGVASARLRV